MRGAVAAVLLGAGVAAGQDGIAAMYVAPSPSRVVHRADAVAVGTVTAVEPQPQTLPVPRPFFWMPAEWAPAPVVRVRVEERLLGRPTPAEVRVGMFTPPAVGERRVFLLGPPGADGLRTLVPHVWEAVPPDAAAGRSVRHACEVLRDPLAGLTAATPADRYRAADVLVGRWADRPDGGAWPPRQRVPGELLGLALRAVADWPDWSAPPADARPPETLLWAVGLPTAGGPGHLRVWNGWSWPHAAAPPFDDSEFGTVVLDWVAMAAECGWDARSLAAAVRTAYDEANQTLPPARVPPAEDLVVQFSFWVQPLIGWAAADRLREWHQARYAQAAFRMWLDGAGRRFVWHTPADGPGSPAGGGWWHEPAGRPR